MIGSGVGLGLLVMFFWGISEFLSAILGRKIGPSKSVFYVQIIGSLLLLPLLFIFPQTAEFSLKMVLYLAGAVICGTVAYWSFFKALKVGKTNMVFPVTSAFSIVTVILGVLFLGERLTLLQVLGIFVALAGAFLVAGTMKVNRDQIKYVILTFVGWGSLFFFIGLMAKSMGWLLPTITYRSLSALVMLFYARKRDHDVFPNFFKKSKIMIVLLGVTIVDVLAFLVFNIATTTNSVSLITPIASAYPIISVVLASFVFKEKMNWIQKIGVPIIILGIIALSL